MRKWTIKAPAAAFLVSAALFAAPPDAAKGKTIYTKQCAACHGPEGVAREAFAKRMGVEMHALGSPEVLAKSDDELRKNITAGVGKMHPVKLKPDEANDVIAYLRTLGKSAAAAKAEKAPATAAAEKAPATAKAEKAPATAKAEKAPATAKAEKAPATAKAEKAPATKSEPAAKAAPAADSAKGKAVFAKQCAGCHGPDGAGKAAIAKTLKVTMRPLASKEVQAKTDAELRKNVSEGTGKMKPVKLAAADLDNVIAFVRALK